MCPTQVNLAKMETMELNTNLELWIVNTMLFSVI